MRWIKVLAAGLLFMSFAGEASAGCRFNAQTPIGKYGGFSFYRGLIYQKDSQTGKRLTAYAGVRTKNIGYCALTCGSKINCRAVTWRGGLGNNCLLFAGYDFVTKRPMGLHIYNGGGRARSAIVRANFRGRICR